MSHPTMSKTLMVTGLAGVLLFTSACSGGNETEASPSAPPSASTAAVPSSTPTPTATAEAVEYGPTIEGMVTLEELAVDKNGTWRKTTILPDDPAFTFAPEVVDGTAKAFWSEEDIKEAQRLAVEMAVDAIDTPANGALGDSESMEKWWAVNKDKFHGDWEDEMYQAAVNTDVNQPLVYKAEHRQHEDTALDYGMFYGEDEIHVKDREIVTTGIKSGEVSQGKAIDVTLEISFTNVVNIDDEKHFEKASTTTGYTMTKDEGTGKFLVVGFNTTYKTVPLR